MMIPEPTTEQCEKNEVVCQNDTQIGYAIWYPQVGGYTGKAVAVMDRNWVCFPNDSRTGGCVDLHIWHDGEFPFGDGCPAIHIHHCDPHQFIRFGQLLTRLNAYGHNRGNQGHGHVTPRADGFKARCGGPSICTECALEAARIAK